MLPRAVLRSAHAVSRQRTALAASRLATARITTPALATWSRGMAKNRGPGQGQSFSQQKNEPELRKTPASPEQPSPTSSSEIRTSKEPASESSKASEPAAAQDATPESASEQPKSFDQLPDLTQGIPSTLEYEMAGATDKAALSTVPEAEGESSGGSGRARGELPASAYVSSSDRKRQAMFQWLYGGILAMGLGGVAYLGRDWTEEEAKAHPEIPNGWAVNLWWKRAMARSGEVLHYYHEPAFEKLLPDPDPMFERPYTLCISLEDMLLHSEWTREHGWRVAKRPGVDYFLRYLSQYYELVLFTTVPFAMGEPMVRKLDPYRIIMWPLFREATKFKDGEIVKDLSYLNRDLSKVIIIDSNAKHVRQQPDNAIVLPPWKGDPKDKDLISLIPFLEYIHTMQYKDVREVLKSFDGKNIPAEFARREAIARAEFNKQMETERKKRRATSGMGALGNMLGLKPGHMSMMVPAEGEQSASEAFAQGKMLQDIARERGQRNYELLEKEIRENGEKWLKDEKEAMDKAQAEAMAGMKTSFTGWFVPPTPTKKEGEGEKKQ